MQYDWDFGVVFEQQHLLLLGQGFLLTILLTMVAIVIGTPLGVFVGSLSCIGRFPGLEKKANRTEGSSFVPILYACVRLLALAYVDLIRAVPLLLLILLSYYGLPAMVRAIGVGGEVSAFTTCVVALSINLSAFVADLVRGAAGAVSKGGILAARSLGMSKSLTWRRIVIPEVIRELVPGLTLLYITIFKMSTLCSTVTVYEVLHSADAVIQRTYKPLEMYVAVAVMFVIVIVPLSAVARRLERTEMLLRRTA